MLHCKIILTSTNIFIPSTQKTYLLADVVQSTGQTNEWLDDLGGKPVHLVLAADIILTETRHIYGIRYLRYTPNPGLYFPFLDVCDQFGVKISRVGTVEPHPFRRWIWGVQCLCAASVALSIAGAEFIHTKAAHRDAILKRHSLAASKTMANFQHIIAENHQRFSEIANVTTSISHAQGLITSIVSSSGKIRLHAMVPTSTIDTIDTQKWITRRTQITTDWILIDASSI